MKSNQQKSWEERLIFIEKIKNLDLEKSTIEEIRNIVSDFNDDLYITSLNFPVGMNLFRAIAYVSKPLYWEDIIYPPTEKAKINRASNVGEQMFYCATFKKTALYEIDAKIGDKIVISHWTNEHKLALQNIGYNNEELTNMSLAYRAPINLEPDIDDINFKINAYIKKAFSSKINSDVDYKLTIGIAKSFLSTLVWDKKEKNERVIEYDGLIYHTIRLDNQSDNIALSPRVVNTGKISFHEIEYIEIIDRKDDLYVYKLLDYADSITEGQIHWRGFEKSWIVTDEHENFYFEGSELFTMEGNLIESFE